MIVCKLTNWLMIFSGKSFSPRRHHGLSVLVEAGRLRNELGAVAGNQSKTSGCARRYLTEKYYLEGIFFCWMNFPKTNIDEKNKIWKSYGFY